MKQTKLSFSITGFLIGLVLVSMIMFGFGTLSTELQDSYDIKGNYNLSKYDHYQTLKNNMGTANDSANRETIIGTTELGEDKGAFDIIGSFFSGGFAAIKTTWSSYAVFGSMMDAAASDIPAFSFVKDYIILIIMVMIVLGVIVTVLVKMNI